MKRLILPVVAGIFMLTACAGRLVALEGEPGETPSSGGTGSGVGGSSPLDCGQALLAKDCPSGSTWSKCQSCSNTSCHGKETPVIPGFDLSSSGIGDGTQFIGKPASTDMAGACSPMSMPPVTGQVYIDKDNPENSLIYKKVTSNFGCGSQMPFAVVTQLTATQQLCILDWIRKVPGVKSNGGENAMDGAAGSQR